MAGEKMEHIYCWEIHEDGLSIFLASSGKGGKGVRVRLKEEADCLEYFEEVFPFSRVVEDHEMNRPLQEAVQAALRGRPVSSDLAFDSECTPFHWTALKAIARIPFGETKTYGEVARMVGRPRGARAIGQAMKRNPFPLVFP